MERRCTVDPHVFSKKYLLIYQTIQLEVSAILRQELSGFKSEAELEEIGSVLQIGDGIARIYGLDNAEAGEIVEFEKNGLKSIILNLEQDNVGVVLLGDAADLNEGDIVKRTGKIASIQVGEGLLGRVINTLGEPIRIKVPQQAYWIQTTPDNSLVDK